MLFYVFVEIDLTNVRSVLGEENLTVEDLLCYVLAKVYSKVNWRRIARGRDSLDVFQHRVLASAYQPSFSRFLEKLCRSLGVQSVRVESEVLEYLNKHSDYVLNMIRHNSIYLVVKMYDIYKRLRDLKKSE